MAITEKSRTDGLQDRPPRTATTEDCRRRPDWGFVARGVGVCVLLAVALVPAALGWAFMPAFGIALGLPAVVMFARIADRCPSGRCTSAVTLHS
jgi:hypothetical protein